MSLKDITVTDVALYFLPVKTRMPYKFGTHLLTEVVSARVSVKVKTGEGKTAEGWGETPLSVGWVWPGSAMAYKEREDALLSFCKKLAGALADFEEKGHALEIGHAFTQKALPELAADFSQSALSDKEPLPELAALVCFSAFDLALHDAYGKVHGVPTYHTYTSAFLNHDLSHYLQADPGFEGVFDGTYPADFLVKERPTAVPVWHAVGGTDPLTAEDLTGEEPDDGYPVLLADWIKADGIKCLKIKLHGDDPEWDYHRILRCAEIGFPLGVDWFCTDFNCTVKDPEYVTDLLDRLMVEHPRIHGAILYVEQPFPHDLKAHQMNVHAVSARKPLFMDESAHTWEIVRLGRKLGWTGNALKTCKTQTGALLSGAWARAHGMTLMVQDLTNPMMAQMTHLLLAAHFGTIMGLESNGMQFYPAASAPEEAVHPGVFKREKGVLNLSTLTGPGFGYQLDKIKRTLPEPAVAYKTP